ncbi:hypothetical protein GOP47_0027870 [Adiantum capillus-veneris]|nr:hypothetical protein GOP47_0027870 [Adiantum capillus-veneris]
MGQTKIVMKRALRGLYAGRHIQFGNMISEDGGNKSRRSWKPNRQKKRLFSFGLDGYIRLDVTTHALRCMDRVGGLDEYLLKLPLKEIHSEKLLELRNRIARHYDKKTMVPKGLEEKIRAVMEWSVEQKTKKADGVAEKGDKTDDEKVAGSILESSEEDYLDKLFAKFTVKQEQEPPPTPPEKKESSPLEVALNNLGDSSTKPTPRRSPEEFPDTLFS